MVKQSQSLPRVNLYLVGFMGTGKSTHGRAVAKRLGYRFIDTDQEIERQAGRSIREIFATEGETGFRERERELIQNGHPAEGCVVSCGGGLVTAPGVLEMLRKKGVVIALVASADCIWERTRGNEDRPLLNGPDPRGTIQSLLREREPLYRKAGPRVLTDNRSKLEIQNNLIRVYRRRTKEMVRAGDPPFADDRAAQTSP